VSLGFVAGHSDSRCRSYRINASTPFVDDQIRVHRKVFLQPQRRSSGALRGFIAQRPLERSVRFHRL
jgi:hypothetical protein